MSDASSVDIASPDWWLHRLSGMLLLDQPRMALMDRYYRGHHPLPDVPRKLREEYRQMLIRSRSNFMRIVVEAPAERLRVQGFRVGEETSADSDDWAWWLASGMGTQAGLSIVDSLVMGRSYLAVYPSPTGPRVRVEDPRTTIVDYDPDDASLRAAALTAWIDEWTGNVMAEVTTRFTVARWVCRRPQVLASSMWPRSEWQPGWPIRELDVSQQALASREEPAHTFGQWMAQWELVDSYPNTWGLIPVIPVVNNPATGRRPDGESELADVYTTQDRINDMLFNRSLAAWTTAYRQKWATGLDIPVDEHGNAVQPYEAAIDRLWVAGDPDVKFGEFSANDLKPYIESIEEDVQHIAVQTRTPRHYFLVQGQAPSGDAIKSAEAGLVAKVVAKQAHIGAAFAEAVRVRHLVAEGRDVPVETVWADPEFRTLAELTDAVIKQYQTGLIPLRVAQEKLGFSPSEISRMESMRLQEQMLAELAGEALGEAPLDEGTEEPVEEPVIGG